MLELHSIRTQLTDRLATLTARVGHFEAERDQIPDGPALAVKSRSIPDALEIAALDELQQTRRALRRLDGGTFGICQACRSPISDHRLAVLPAATLCIDCVIADAH